MTSKQYSNREIDLIIKGVTEHIDSCTTNQNYQLDSISAEVSKILAQTTKTNGRVTRLEGWRSFLVGAWIIVSGFVLPLMVYILVAEKDNVQNQLGDIKNLIELKHQ
jgi:hypothetical protein